MRLIDADALRDIEKILDNDVAKDVPAAYWVMKNVLERINKITTIDPEALPVVRELREQLARVTAERDAAFADLYAAKACKTCALQFSDDCLLEECFEPCSAVLSENTPYRWRGDPKDTTTLSESEIQDSLLSARDNPIPEIDRIGDEAYEMMRKIAQNEISMVDHTVKTYTGESFEDLIRSERIERTIQQKGVNQVESKYIIDGFPAFSIVYGLDMNDRTIKEQVVLAQGWPGNMPITTKGE